MARQAGHGRAATGWPGLAQPGPSPSLPSNNAPNVLVWRQPGQQWFCWPVPGLDAPWGYAHSHANTTCSHARVNSPEGHELAVGGRTTGACRAWACPGLHRAPAHQHCSDHILAGIDRCPIMAHNLAWEGRVRQALHGLAGLEAGESWPGPGHRTCTAHMMGS